MAERMHRTQVLLPEAEYRRLKRAAKQQHRSVASLLREPVTYYRERQDRQADWERRLAALEGAFPNVSLEGYRDETDRDLG